MPRGKRSKKAANRKKHQAKGNSEKFSMASESEADTASDAGGPVTDNAGEPANRAVDGVADLKPGVSSSLNECTASGDCGSDSCKLKADTAVNEAYYAGGIQRLLGNFGVFIKSGPAGFFDGINEADGALQNRAGEGSHADSNQSSGQMGFKDKAGDRHSQKGVNRKRVRPNVVLTEEEEAFIAEAGIPIYLMPAMAEVIESRRNYPFLRKQAGSGKARIVFEEALAGHGLAHAPNGVDPRLFLKQDASSKGVSGKRSDPQQASFQEGLSTPGVKKGISGTD